MLKDLSLINKLCRAKKLKKKKDNELRVIQGKASTLFIDVKLDSTTSKLKLSIQPQIIQANKANISKEYKAIKQAVLNPQNILNNGGRRYKDDLNSLSCNLTGDNRDRAIQTLSKGWDLYEDG